MEQKTKTIYQRHLLETPDTLVSDGQINFGCFKQPFKKVNLIDAKQPYKLPLPKLLKNIQLREWQAFQIGNKDYFVMMAIYNAKKMALVQFILYDIKAKKKVRYEKKVAAWQLNVPNSLYDTKAGYRSKNFTIAVHHDIEKKKLSIAVEIKNFQDLPDVKAHFVGIHDTEKYRPTVVCLPFSAKRAMYSHKCLMPMYGQINIDNKCIDFDIESSHLILDDHKGYYPFPTRYDWVTSFGYNKKNELFGLNLTDNQVVKQELYNENCLWLNGNLHLLPPIKVKRKGGTKGDWLIKDRFDMVNLVFTPTVHTSVNINLLVFKSKYEGPYGWLNGYVRKADGEKVMIENMFAMGEDFYLRV